MAKIDEKYHYLLNYVLETGYTYEDPNRKGVNRIEIPSYTFRHEFKDGFPAITTKKLHYKNVVTELIWFLRGDTNIKYLVDNGCNIWNKDGYNYYCKKCKESDNAEPYNFAKFIDVTKTFDYSKVKNPSFKFGDLGKVYGHFWRNFDGVDQIAELISDMINKPMSSELIVAARNPSYRDNQALPCCHDYFQIVMKPLNLKERIVLLKQLPYDKSLEGIPGDSWLPVLEKANIPKYGFELHWHQRSVDTFLGLPYNIASYATLALILERLTGHKALAIQGDLKKVHLYDNSIEAVKEQLSRDVNKYNECELGGLDHIGIHKVEDLSETFNFWKPSDFYLKNYESYPAINVPMLERDE